MKISKTLNLLEYTHYLVKNCSTGSPKDLARKLKLSERQVYRLITELKELGFPIEYSKFRGSYHYTHQVVFKIVFEKPDLIIN